MERVASAQADPNWPMYRLTYISRKFFEGVKEGFSEFQAPSDESAIRYTWLLIEGVLMAVFPNGGGTSRMRPRKLTEVLTGRLVRDFAANDEYHVEAACSICGKPMAASREGWTCSCGNKNGWV